MASPRLPDLVSQFARTAVFATRASRNAVLDARYGWPVIGSQKTRHGDRGAADVVNTDWAALRRIFAGTVWPDDVLVDIGCGRGRVLNYWLAHHPGHRIVGIELDERVAHRTARRLRRHANVEIIAGDAVDELPDDATLLFLFNPFDAANVERLACRLQERCHDGLTRLLYYNPKHLDVFTRRPTWHVERHDIGGGRWAPYSDLAIIRPSAQ